METDLLVSLKFAIGLVLGIERLSSRYFSVLNTFLTILILKTLKSLQKRFGEPDSMISESKLFKKQYSKDFNEANNCCGSITVKTCLN